MQVIPRLELESSFLYEIFFFLVKIFGLHLHFETYPKHPPEGSEQDQSFGGICFSSKG